MRHMIIRLVFPNHISRVMFFDDSCQKQPSRHNNNTILGRVLRGGRSPIK
jgi:hypothetical protein